MSAKNKSNEINITRIYDAPVQAVWDAWADPKKAAQWWGPRGFTITTQSKELKPGGHWSYIMVGPDGTTWNNKTIYLEVEACKKLVYDHGGHDDRPPLFRVTVLFSEINGKTKMEMSMKLPTPEEADKTRAIIKKTGGNSTWDRLAEYLEHEETGKEKFIIYRGFDAPIEPMFTMWTDPKYFSQWLAPTGFTMQFVRADIRTGGSIFYFIEGEGIKMYGRAEYLRIEKPNLISYTQQFCDEHEKLSRHPMSPTWPATMLTTVTLAEEGINRTRVTVTWEPHRNVSAEELDTFIKARSDMTQGWTGSFDKLDSYLAESGQQLRHASAG